MENTITFDYQAITSKDALIQATGSWVQLEALLGGLQKQPKELGQQIEVFARQFISSKGMANITKLKQQYAGRYIGAIAQDLLATKNESPKAQPTMAVKTSTRLQKHKPSTGKQVGIGDTLLLADKEVSLFKIYIEHEAQQGYERGFYRYMYSRDYQSERKFFASKEGVKAVEMMLSNKMPPWDIFGGGGLRQRPFNGWYYNFDKYISRWADQPHPEYGYLIKAMIYFQPIRVDTPAGALPLELFRFEDDRNRYA